jgi:hypothetical protein
MLWIRIRMDPHQIKRKDLDPHQSEKLDPDPDQSDKVYPDPNPHQFADEKPKCMEYVPTVFEPFLSLHLEAKIRIRIRVNATHTRILMGQH